MRLCRHAVGGALLVGLAAGCGQSVTTPSPGGTPAGAAGAATGAGSANAGPADATGSAKGGTANAGTAGANSAPAAGGAAIPTVKDSKAVRLPMPPPPPGAPK
jgi:hypothetical protein